MKKKIIKISIMAVTTLVFGAFLMFSVEKNKDSNWQGAISTSFAEGSEGSGGSGLLWSKVMTNSTCTSTRTVDIWTAGGFIYYVFVAGAVHSTKTETFTGKMSRCDDGWSFCSSGCEGA